MSDDAKRQRRVGAYAKLLANYASDDAIIAAGEAAELLFVRGLAFCATSDADGYITDAQVTRYVGAGMKDAPKRAERLAEAGVWERVGGGYVVRSWTKIHETSVQRGRRLKADRERKARAPIQSDTVVESDATPPGIQTEGVSDSLSLIQSTTDTRQRNDTTVQVGSPLSEDRNEPLRAADATSPAKGPCTRHPNGNPTNEPCHGCKRSNDLTERRGDRAAEVARLDVERRSRSCRRCDGAHVIDDEGKPTKRKCDHGALSSVAGDAS